MNLGIPAYCHPYDAPYEIELPGFSDSVEAFTLGLPGDVRPDLLGTNSVLLCIIMAMILIVIFNIRECPRFFSKLTDDLMSSRRRPNAFNERTLNEVRVTDVFILQLCVCEALLLLPLLRQIGLNIPGAMIPIAIGLLIGLTIIYYVAQLCIYRLIGYVFSDKISSRLWIRGFNASQVLLGWTLILPALAVLFYPATTDYLLPLSGFLYILARILFFSKGFRIFYHDFSSLLYFIFYLCSVEIVPLIIAYHAIFLLYRNIVF